MDLTQIGELTETAGAKEAGIQVRHELMNPRQPIAWTERRSRKLRE